MCESTTKVIYGYLPQEVIRQADAEVESDIAAPGEADVSHRLSWSSPREFPERRTRVGKRRLCPGVLLVEVSYQGLKRGENGLVKLRENELAEILPLFGFALCLGLRRLLCRAGL